VIAEPTVDEGRKAATKSICISLRNEVEEGLGVPAMEKKGGKKTCQGGKSAP